MAMWLSLEAICVFINGFMPGNEEKITMTAERNSLLGDGDGKAIYNSINENLEAKSSPNSNEINLEEDAHMEIPPQSAATGNSHCHPRYKYNKELDKPAFNKLLFVVLISVVATIGVFVGGIISNSISVMSDAACLAADVISFTINAIMVYQSTKPSSKKLNFGMYRGEVLGGLFSMLLLWAMTGVLIYLAVDRFTFEDDFEMDSIAMLISAILGLLIDAVMTVILCDTRSGCCYRNSDDGKKIKQKNISVGSAFFHMLGDTLHSIGVLAAAIIIWVKPEWQIADAIATFIASAVVYAASIRFIYQSLLILMEGTPSAVDYDEVETSILKVEGVIAVHSLRIWSLTPQHNVVMAHLVIESNARNSPEIQNDVASFMLTSYGIKDVTIQVEDYVVEMDRCDQCSFKYS